MVQNVKSILFGCCCLVIRRSSAVFIAFYFWNLVVFQLLGSNLACKRLNSQYLGLVCKIMVLGNTLYVKQHVASW